MKGVATHKQVVWWCIIALTCLAGTAPLIGWLIFVVTVTITCMAKVMMIQCRTISFDHKVFNTGKTYIYSLFHMSKQHKIWPNTNSMLLGSTFSTSHKPLVFQRELQVRSTCDPMPERSRAGANVVRGSKQHNSDLD